MGGIAPAGVEYVLIGISECWCGDVSMGKLKHLINLITYDAVQPGAEVICRGQTRDIRE